MVDQADNPLLWTNSDGPHGVRLPPKVARTIFGLLFTLFVFTVPAAPAISQKAWSTEPWVEGAPTSESPSWTG
jgi:hypothetical protein